MNMVKVEKKDDRFDLANDRASWRRLFHTLEKQRYITPLEAPPRPSTGDACEYHSGARGHSLECCKEFKEEIASLIERGLIRGEEAQPEGSRLPNNQSDLNWYEEVDLEDIIEEEMDLDDLLDEEDFKGYCVEEEMYENGNPESHLQKYCEKMALHTENELLMISTFFESLSRRAAT